MNNHGVPAPGAGDQSALSLLVNAADSHDPPRTQMDASRGGGPSLADTLRLRGLSGAGATLEEQLLLQQQQQQQQQQLQQHSQHQQQGLSSHQGLLAQLRDQNLLSQLNQQQIASLLGMGGGAGPAPTPSGHGGDMRAVLAAAQLRQQSNQLSHADILALGRPGGYSAAGLSGILGGGIGGGGLPSELEGQLQRLEELERQHRILTASTQQLSAGGLSREALEAAQLQSLPPHLRQQLSQVERQPQQQQLQQQQHQLQQLQQQRLQQQQLQQQQVLSQPQSAANHDQGAADHDGLGANSAHDNVPKDEIEKAPGSVIVPCRARGMPMDHNFKTAYFVIPENVKHGEELICSYFACRNAGIKFRYCSHCKVPVAKRNFRKRHKHGGEIAAGEDSGAEDDASVTVPHNKKGIPSQIMASHEEPEERDGLSSPSSNSENQKEQQTTEQVQRGLVQSSMRNFQQGRMHKTQSNVPSPAEGGTISPERKQRWEELLKKRPSTKEGDMMSNWLMQVLAVSDLDTPLKHAAEDVAAPAAAEKTKAKEVVAEDPETEDDVEGNIGSGVVIKKKRPAVLLAGAGDRPESYAGGSFAEWKERKKQRKLAKSQEAASNDEEEEEGEIQLGGK